MADDLLREVERLREVLPAVRLPLSTPDSRSARRTARDVAEQLDDYILPRLQALDAPLLSVVGGSTGSGKSTLVNSLLGRQVTPAGVRRPTTRQPVLAVNPADAAWFTGARVLPRLPRISGSTVVTAEQPRGLRLVEDPAVPVGLVLLDAPDIDSVAADNRELAAELMAAADLWIFLTTAARYADAVPWAALRGAQARNASVAVVLNRVPAEALDEVGEHLAELLAGAGLAQAPLFIIPELPLESGMLPRASIKPLADWLTGLAGDAASRVAVARRTLAGAIADLVGQVELVAAELAEQGRTADRLRGSVEPPFKAAARRLREYTEDGSILRGEVLRSWQDFVGAGETFRKLETAVARWRDRVSASFRGQPPPPERVVEAIETGLVRVLVAELATASEQVDAAWRAHPAGVALLGGEDLATPDPAAQQAAVRLVQAWQADVLALIRGEGSGRRQSARLLAYGVNAVALMLIIVVFSASGGLTGAEVGIAGGATLLAQKVLEAVFSEDAVRRMSVQARAALANRVEEYLDHGAQRFTDRVNRLDLAPEAAAELVLAARSVAAAATARRVADAGPLPTEPPVVPASRPRWRDSMREMLRGSQ